MIPNHYIRNGCFTKHPLEYGCLGYQDGFSSENLAASFLKKWIGAGSSKPFPLGHVSHLEKSLVLVTVHIGDELSYPVMWGYIFSIPY